MIQNVWMTGLSPRVRGNPEDGAYTLTLRRSIPACAGEPRAIGATSAGVRVYPRVCGGTTVDNAALAAASGLSPRVRGNPFWRAPR